MNYLIGYLTIFSLFINLTLSNLLDLNDKFLDVYKNDHSRAWLIKFFAPWCIHCKNLEQTYKEVANLVKEDGFSNVIVGRIDCTKYTSVATHFGVRGFPTIMYIDSKKIVEFIGDRNKEEMLEFVRRLNGPSIKKLNNCDDIEKVKKQHNVFFINFNDDDQPNSNFSDSANQFHSTDWFFHLNKKCSNYDPNSIYCVKTSARNNVILRKFNNNMLLNDWIKLERFPKFLRFSLSNINYLMNSGKILAIALIGDSRGSPGKFNNLKDKEYYEQLEFLANNYPLNDQFIFGWTNQLDMINSIAIQTLEPIPNYIFINTSSMNYYLYDETKNNEQKLVKILDSFINGKPILIEQGGSGYLNKLRRLSYDGYIAISMMFESNPILTVILFGFPLCFFSIIVYCSLCSDIVDDRDEFCNEELSSSCEEDDDENELIKDESIEEDEDNLKIEKDNQGHLKSE